MTDNAIKKGDVVQLKSGSPEMTVQELHRVETGENALCLWFKDSQAQSHWFDAESLKHVY